MPDAPGRPETGTGHYLRDLVYGALDGVITTLAVVAGVTGASLAPRVAVILGLANLAADGLSMGASNYLGLKSELQQRGAPVSQEMPWRHGLATLAAFVVAGAVPVLAFALPHPPFVDHLRLATGLSAVTLFLVGAARTRFVPGSAFRLGLEMLLVGMAAAGAAYGIGWSAERLF